MTLIDFLWMVAAVGIGMFVTLFAVPFFIFLWSKACAAGIEAGKRSSEKELSE